MPPTTETLEEAEGKKKKECQEKKYPVRATRLDSVGAFVNVDGVLAWLRKHDGH